jgi:glutathione S-transferase
VYAHPGSGNAIPLMLFGLIHLKEKYTFQMCNIMTGEQMSPDFLAMNPFHQVPTAKLSDGTCMFEGCASLRFLATKYAKDTYPADKQLFIDMAMDKRQTNFYKAWSPIGYYAMQIAGKPEPDAAQKLTAVLKDMGDFFLKEKFIGGDKICIADYAMLPLINTLSLPTVKKIGYTLPERWATYLEDAKKAIGDPWKEAVAVHEGWVGSNEPAVEAIKFEDSAKTPGTSEWKIEAVPDGGVLLCGHPGSGNVIGPRMFALKHMGDKFKFQMCDIMKGEQWSPDFLAINPFHEVPSAKLSDGTGMFESTSMLRYMARTYKPETYPEAKALKIDMFMDKRQGDFYKVWSPIGYYAMQIGPAPGTDAAKKLNGVLATMGECFLTDRFVGGDQICIADFAILPLINTLSLPTTKKIGYVLPERWAKYLSDAKAELGTSFATACAEHEGWVGSNEAAVSAIKFDA